ncbi:hypothetical protein SAMN05216326_12524 [Nitrosomonas marina]|uniref:Uncharacterized protein n=1 Tax=Nitrosomonas marina TaxID=917 RepID=A0A1I0E5T7_9PROT|nr:hypothetical protein [Nitrosomonas marina]SET40507.1 hypothetical protein SAMN05216326_12524 [Nitrosomonas marina]
MKVTNFDHQKAAQRRSTAMLNDFQRKAEILLQERISIHEMIDCLCEAISNTQVNHMNEESLEYQNLQFCHDVIESTTCALELDRRSSPEISKANGLIEMQKRLEKIKKELS